MPVEGNRAPSRLRDCQRILFVPFAVSALMACSVVSLSSAQDHNLSATSAQPRTPLDYFRRADDLTNIRMFGSAPFHMKVTFQALPGVDFAKPGKSDIITGNGTYEEWWRSPEEWRREVTLADYHAVEVRAGGVRRMQASSDYEPSRVLMLLQALLTPIPRGLVETNLDRTLASWTLRHLQAGGLPYVRISSELRAGNGNTYFTGFSFLVSGLPVRSDDVTSMMTEWASYRSFAGKAVPGKITVRAMNRILLTADIAVEPLLPSCPIIQLSGPAAQPGFTLRPLYDSKLNSLASGYAFTGDMGRFAWREVVDQSGKPREVELLATDDVNSAKAVLPHLQSERFRPPTIDGSPCEVATSQIY